MNPESSKGLSKPPRGVVTGKTVPRDEEQDKVFESYVEEVKNHLKTHPVYGQFSESKREKKARQIVGVE